MATDETIRTDSAPPYGWSHTVGILNPLRAVWWLFTNVRFAIFLLAALCLVSLLGVLVPQMPANLRGDPIAEARWLDQQEGRFAFLSEPMDKLGVFDLFHAGWFSILLALTVASTAAYVLSRLPGIWTSITRPRTRVPDRYFGLAPQRLALSEPLDPGALERVLRRNRYGVERTKEGGVTYLFADRFAFAQLGTLLTHVAVIVFILSAVVSRVDAFKSNLFIHEGGSLPVFPVRHPNQIQVELLDARAAFAPDGQALDYRAELVLYQNGEEVKRCTSTINSPCNYAGYTFYQASYYGFGAELQVRDLATGNVIYRETLALSETVPAPRVRITDAAGRILLDDKLILTEELHTGDVEYRGALVRLDGGRALTIGLLRAGADEEPRLVVTDPDPAGGNLSLLPTETATIEGLRVTYVARSMTPSAQLTEVPRPDSAPLAIPVRAQLDNVYYGTNNVSEGESGAPAADGEPQLTLTGLRAQPLVLSPGDSTRIDGYEYTFVERREFAGIEVKRDRSDYLVWAGAALIVLGLVLTFWVPRRRLWARIDSEGVALAGQAPAGADLNGELRGIARAAGADLPQHEDSND